MTTSSHIYAVIMAGGGGTRLWPVSRSQKPKQLLPLIGTETLFQNTVERLSGLISPANVLVVTVAQQAAEMKKQSPGIPDENFLIEPAPKGTASVVGLAAKYLAEKDPEAVMVVLPADHFIKNKDLFSFILNSAIDVAMAGYLVTLGISPTYAATAYGYIQQGQAVQGQFKYPAYRVERFKEKPDAATAQEMLQIGNYSWNSGIFIWQVQTILAEFRNQMPILADTLDKIDLSFASKPDAAFGAIWGSLVSETIDYGVMEKAEKVAVLPASGLGWSDVGSWDSLFEVLMPDNNGNIFVNSEHVQIDTNNSLVYSTNGKNRLVVTIGVDDLAIIETGDVLLVCKTDQSQKVKDIVTRLKEAGRQEYL